MVHHTIGKNFKENLAFVTSKMRIQEIFFPLHTADAYMYTNVPNCDVLTLFSPSGVFILMKLVDARSHDTTKIHSQWINK